MGQLYYFIEKKNKKLGPFGLSELKQKTIFANDLIWRSDSECWRKASEFEELNEIFVVNPPMTPKEQSKKESTKKFISVITSLIIIYLLASLLLGFIAYSIADSSWQSYLGQQGGMQYGQEPGVVLGDYSGYSYSIALKRYLANSNSTFQRGANNEAFNGANQDFLFRPFKAFGSIIYLTKKEQENSFALLGNLILSSLVSLSFFFLIIGLVLYLVISGSKKTEIQNPETNLLS